MDFARSRDERLLLEQTTNFIARHCPREAVRNWDRDEPSVMLLWMSSRDLGGVVFGQPGMDLGLGIRVSGEARLDAGQPLDGDVELLGDGAQGQASVGAQSPEFDAAGREW